LGQVEDDFFLVSANELADGVAELSGFVAEGDASVDVDNRDVADFASAYLHGKSGRLIGLRTKTI
jgi:hypothetical protein